MSQEITQKSPTSTSLPPFKKWPTSKPGPRAMQPPSGHKPMVGRTEQVVGNEYEPGANGSGAEADVLPDVVRKPKRK